MNTFHVYLYGPDCGALETSFEDAAARLEQMPRLYLEPDGSFVWTQSGGEQQIFGMLYDAANQLQYVELRGCCCRENWQRLVTAIRGATEHKLAVMSLPSRQLQDLQGFENSTFR